MTRGMTTASAASKTIAVTTVHATIAFVCDLTLIGKAAFVDLAAEDGADLDVEIGVMLRGSPNHEDEVVGVNRCEAAFRHPLADDACLVVNQHFQRCRQERFDRGGTMQDFVGEQARGFGLFG